MVLAFVAADGALGPELLVADVAGEVLDLQVDAVLVGLEKRRIVEEQGPDFVWNFSPIQVRLELIKIIPDICCTIPGAVSYQIMPGHF